MRSKLLCVLLMLFSLKAYTQGYVPAQPGYHYRFPRDHFNHPDYGTEWWYYTGNLRAKDGHRFGFELTFFRQGASREANAAPWYIHDLYMAHLALTDVSGHRYYATERINRAGPGIAGVNAASQIVWNGNWQTRIGTTGNGEGAHQLHGRGENFSFDLAATPLKPVVIHGQDGVSQKAEGVGHASHYLSFTRMRTAGNVELNGTAYQVEGDAWMDHEFFSDSMTGDEVGWDWLSIQLNDNTELMLYRLRHKDGTVDPYSSGTYVDSGGNTLHLTLRDFTMTQAGGQSGATWKSGQTGATYPVAWSVKIPQLNLGIDITTPLDSQEFVSRFGPSYWEGAIDVAGNRNGNAVRGAGYLEMTGYSHPKSSLIPTSPR